MTASASGPLGVEDVGQRLDTVVAQPAGRVGRQDAGEVAALVEELRRLGQLGRDERRRRRPGARRGTLGLDAEPRPGDAAGEDPGVVARPVDGPGVGRHAVLLEALRALADRPGEEDPGHACALPPRRLDRQPARPERPTPSVGQVDRAGVTNPVAEMTSSTSSDEVRAAIGPSQVHRQAPSRRRSIRSIAASRTLTPPPSTWSSYGWT